MNVPLAISFDIAAPKEPFKELVRDRAEKLEKVCDYLSSCRVAIEESQKHKESGSRYRVRVVLMVVPDHEVIAKREPGYGSLNDETR